MTIIFKHGYGGAALHYGTSESPNSVVCGNHSGSNFTWTTDRDAVTCRACLKKVGTLYFGKAAR